jgi:hypothetical protein
MVAMSLDDPRDFGDALAKGLGRCVVHLRRGAAVEPYRELLLEAFRGAQGYDPQCEGTRAQYLFDLAQAAHLEHELRSAALEGLAACTDDRWDADQHTAVLVRFAERGDDSMGERVLAQFESMSIDSPVFDSFAWVVPRLVGLDGFLLVARRMGEGDDGHGHHGSCDYHRTLANEDFGEATVTAALHSSAATDASIARFLRYSEAYRERRQAPTSIPHIPLAEILALLRTDAENTRPWNRAKVWAWRASAEELQQAAGALESCTDPREQRGLLCMFARSAFPGPLELLVRFVHAEQPEIRDAAIAALGAFENTAARDHAHRLLSLPEPQWEALRLFEHNYQPGDGVFVASLLGKAARDDPDGRHELASLLIDGFCGEDRGDDAVALLRWLYEHTPCSTCRASAVRALLHHDALDGTIAEECAWDTNSEIRELVDPDHA